MLQRIQSVWLLLAAVCYGIQLVPSLAMVQTQVSGQGIFSDQKLYAGELSWMFIGVLLSVIVIAVSIFLFKNRGTQILLVAVGNLIQLIFVLGGTFFTLNAEKMMETFSPNAGMFSGMLGLVFSWLATRAIRKDEELVKSMDRLR